MRFVRFMLVSLIATSVVSHAFADDGSGKRPINPRTDVLYLSGGGNGTTGTSLTTDARGSMRSVPQAFAMSVVVPGLGQVYNKDWLKAGIAVALEAVFITAYASWKSKGNDGVRDYEAYANQHWSPIKYAEWLNNYSGYTGSEIGPTTLSEDDFKNPGDWTGADRAEADRFFNDIRAAERNSIYLSTGAGFSHVLPFFGEQQYYELVGKYFQYAPGWADYGFEPDVNAEDVLPSDTQFYYYAGIHADANDYLRKSSWAGVFVIMNHFAAGIEAAVSAKLYNMSLRPTAAMKFGPTGEPVATAGVVLDL